MTFEDLSSPTDPGAAGMGTAKGGVPEEAPARAWASARLVAVAGLVWLVILAASLAWNWRAAGAFAAELAVGEARTSFEKDLLYRRWATMHGGVYVPPSELTPPNPHLAHLPERDVTTTSGRALTLVNPAYMTRQVYDLARGQQGARGHITSLDPIRPGNAPDAWEAAALHAFEAGSGERHSVEMLEGEPYLRLMRPLVTEAACLKCHAAQGYEVGQVRGGISVAVPFAPYAAVARRHRTNHLVGHLLIGLLGAAGLVLGSRRLARSEKAVRESERLHRTLLEGIPDLVARFDERGRHLYVSGNVTDVVDIPAARFVGRTHRELGFPDEQCRFWERTVRRVFETGEAVETEFPFETRHGPAVVNWRLLPETDAEGTVRSVLSVARDVTEQRRAEQALRASERRLVESQRVARLGHYTFDVLRGRWEGSEVLDEVFGIDADFTRDVAGWLRIIHPDDREQMRAYLAEHVIRDGRPFDAEYRIRRIADDAERWVHGRGSLELDATGRPVRMFGVIQDVSERRSADQALQGSEATRRALLDALPDLVFRLSAEGVHLDFHASDPAELFVPPSEFLGKPVREVLPSEVADLYEQHIRRALGERRMQAFEYRLPFAEGERCYEARMTPGGADEVLVVVREVTERRRAEEERLTLERQVQHTQKLESLGVLAGGIAHDFNNMLVPVLGNASLAALSLPKDSPLRQRLADIEAAARRASELCRQLLAYSGKGTFVVETLDLNRLVEEMAGLVRLSVSKRATITLRLAPVRLAVRADATQLRQVILNLVVNASEAITQAGVITLTTGTLEVDPAAAAKDLPDGRYVSLEVRDSGVGMDAETRTRLFDPFFTTKATGRGLGLSAVLGIVRAHRGAITVDSTPGEGTIFRVLLPRVDGSAVAASAPGSAPDEPWAGEGTVLVVDDEAPVLDVARHILERLGFTTLTARDGDAGVEAFEAHADEIRAVFLDLTMPRLGGREVLSAIRRRRADVPVVLMSGHSEPDVDDPIRREHVAGFLHKPFDVATFTSALKQALLPAQGEPAR